MLAALGGVLGEETLNHGCTGARNWGLGHGVLIVACGPLSRW